MTKTTIEWTDESWNPVRGCVKVSSGCKNCYAERIAERFRGVEGHPYEQGFDLRLAPEKMHEPFSWRRPRRVFVNSMSDLFQEGVPDEFIDQVFAVMMLCFQHTFQILTKRPERMRAYCTQDRERRVVRWEQSAFDMSPTLGSMASFTKALKCYRYDRPLRGNFLSNVCLGVSCETQEHFDQRVPQLLQTPAAVRFVSLEPLLGPIDCRSALSRVVLKRRVDISGLEAYGELPPLHWVIVGGESGPGARPMHPNWVRSIRDECVRNAVPFFFKQWGMWVHTSKNLVVNITPSFTSMGRGIGQDQGFPTFVLVIG